MLSGNKRTVSSQYNVWHKMINFDQPKGTGAAFSIGTVFGWVYYLWKMLDLKSFGVEFFVKLISGTVSAVVIGLCVKISIDYYEKNWKDKIFKDKKPKTTP